MDAYEFSARDADLDAFWFTGAWRHESVATRRVHARATQSTARDTPVA